MKNCTLPSAFVPGEQLLVPRERHFGGEVRVDSHLQSVFTILSSLEGAASALVESVLLSVLVILHFLHLFSAKRIIFHHELQPVHSVCWRSVHLLH